MILDNGWVLFYSFIPCLHPQAIRLLHACSLFIGNCADKVCDTTTPITMYNGMWHISVGGAEVFPCNHGLTPRFFFTTNTSGYSSFTRCLNLESASMA